MKILITGGYGFIGSALIRYLLSNTDHSVINLDALTYAANKLSVPKELKNDRYEFCSVDITHYKTLYETIEKTKPDSIIHLAAESHVDRSIYDPSKFIQTNIIGTYNLLEASRMYLDSLKDHKKSSFRFLHVSTDEVFGDLAEEKDLFHEESPYKPSSPYSASKASSDHLVKAWGRTYNFPYLLTNCSNNYGAYQFPEKFIPRMILNATSGEKLPIYGNGQQIRDWLYVNDHASALVEVLTKGKVGENYNIGGLNEKQNIEVVNNICEILEDLNVSKPSGVGNFIDLISFIDDRPGHDLRYAIDASKIKTDLGWQPKETFQTGLLKTVEWYLTASDWLESIKTKKYRLDA